MDKYYQRIKNEGDKVSTLMTNHIHEWESETSVLPDGTLLIPMKWSIELIEDDDLMVCVECGSHKVQDQMWVNINTGIPDDSLEDEEKYCLRCTDHVEVVNKRYYE